MTAIALLLAFVLALAVGALLAGPLGLTRKPKLPSDARRGPLRNYLDRLQADMLEAGIEGLSAGRLTIYFVFFGLAVGLVFALFLGYLLIGIVAGVLTTFVFARNFYVKRRATARRVKTIEQVAEAAREISDNLDAGMPPMDSLRLYASRSLPGSASASVIRSDNLVARRLLEAIGRIERGMSEEESLRTGAEELDNRYFTGLVETYIQSSKVNARQLGRGLRRLATEVDHTLILRDERAVALRQPETSNRIVGAVIVFIVLVMVAMMPQAGDFYRQMPGQVMLIGMAVWWYFGSRILSSGWGDEL